MDRATAKTTVTTQPAPGHDYRSDSTEANRAHKRVLIDKLNFLIIQQVQNS